MKMLQTTHITAGKRNAIVNYQEGWQGVLESVQYTTGSPSWENINAKQ